jgi:hypothetical protein
MESTATVYDYEVQTLLILHAKRVRPASHGARSVCAVPLRGTKGTGKGARVWYVGVEQF